MNDLTIIDFGIFLIAVVALGLSLYNVYKQHYIRGPEFNLTEARIDARQESFRRVKALIQNIGDRMGCLRWESINIKLGEEIFHILDNRDKEWEWQAQPESQTFKGFTFNVSSDVDLTGAIFFTKGVYSSHKGKMIKKTWEIPLIGMLKPIKEKKGE